MADNEKKLSLTIDSTKAKSGAEEIGKALKGLKTLADDLQKQFNSLNVMKQGSGAGGSSGTIQRTTRATNELTAAQKVAEETTRKLQRSQATLEAARSGALDTLIKTQVEERNAVKTLRDNLSALSNAEKETLALEKAREKLSNTLSAEKARTTALTEATGRESVAKQEQRRITEELLRSEQRLNLLKTESGKRLVQQRFEAEQLTQAYRDQIRGGDRLFGSMSNITSAASALTTAMAGLTVYFSVGGLVRTSDAYTNLANRLSAITRGTVDVTQATREMLEVSIETRSSLESVMDIQTKMIRVNESLGKSQEEVANLTEAVSKAVAMSGASVQGAQGAIMQFAQAMSANWQTSAQELNSILEQTPALAYYMVQGLRDVTGETELTAGTLKRFAEEGGLSAEIVFEAFQRVLPQIREDFAETSRTIASAAQNLQDAFTVTFGEMVTEAGAADVLTDAMTNLAKEMPNLKIQIEAISVALAGLVTGVGGTAIVLALGATGLAIGGVAAALAAAVGSIYYWIRSSEDMEDQIAREQEKLGELTQGLEKYEAAIQTANSTQLNELVSTSQTELIGVVIDMARKQLELEELQQKLNQLQQPVRGAAAMSSSGTQGDPAEIAALEKQIEGLTKKLSTLDEQRKVLAEEGIIGRAQIPVTALREGTQAVTAFSDKTNDIVEAFTESEKAYKKYSEQVNKLTAEYTLAFAKVDAMPDGIKKETEANRLNEEMTRKVGFAKTELGEALDKLSKKEDREAIRARERIERYQAETNQIQDRTQAMLQGEEALAQYNTEQQALRGLGVNEIPSEGDPLYKLWKDRTEAIKENQEVTQELNFASTIENLSEELAAVHNGTEAYQDYLLQKQAIQALGGVVTDSDTARVQALADAMKALQDAQAQVQRDQTIADIDAEIEALKQGEVEYQELLLKRQAAQMLNLEINDENSDQIDDMVEKLKEMANLKINPLSEISNGLQSFKQLADTVGKGSAEMQVAIDAVNAIMAVQAVINQANTNPYTAFASMAAMGAAMGQLGYSIGGLGGSLDANSEWRQEQQGTGSVLGDLGAKSESIANAIEDSADALDKIVGINTGMLNALNSLADAMTGAVSLIARDVDMDIGVFGSVSDNPLQDLVDNLPVIGAIQSTIESIPLIGDIFSGVFGALGGMLGGSSSISDEGINIIGGTIADIIDNTTAMAFQETKSKKYAWSSTKTRTVAQPVADSVEAQFDLVFESLFDTVGQAALGLGYNTSAIENALSNYVVDSFTISLRDLDPAEQAEELNAVFSKVFDDLASSIVPIALEFQKAGEGVGETLARLSTNVTVVGEMINQLDMVDISGTTDDIIRASTAMAELAGGASALVDNFTGFVDAFASEQRQFDILSEQLNSALGLQDSAILKSRDSVYEYISALDASNEADRQRIITITSLTDSLDQYFSMLESLAGNSLSALRESINAQRDALQIEYQDNMTDLNTQITDMSSSIGELENVLTILENGIRSLRVQSTSLDVIRLRASRSALSSMASAYTGSGILPDSDRLGNLIGDLSGDNRQYYSTFAEYVKDQAKSSQDLRDMSEFTEDQLSIDQKMLNSLEEQVEILDLSYQAQLQQLEDMYEYYESELNALMGIDESIASVESAVNAVVAAIASLSFATGQSSGVINSAATQFSNQEVSATAQAVYEQSVTNGVMDWDAAESRIAQLAIENNVTAEQLAQSLGTTVENVNSTANRLGYQLPQLSDFIDGSHANGADEIPFDNYVANLHKGEMVLTAPVADMVRDMAYKPRGNEDSSQVASLLQQLINIVQSDSYNTNKKLLKLVDMERIITKWDNQGTPQDRAYAN